jgi:hypothetical protein
LFGIRFAMTNTTFNIIKKHTNFKVVLAIEDLIADVFKLGFGQKNPTYVPILKKNIRAPRKNRK